MNLSMNLLHWFSVDGSALCNTPLGLRGGPEKFCSLSFIPIFATQGDQHVIVCVRVRAPPGSTLRLSPRSLVIHCLGSGVPDVPAKGAPRHAAGVWGRVFQWFSIWRNCSVRMPPRVGLATSHRNRFIEDKTHNPSKTITDKVGQRHSELPQACTEAAG
uniref:Uncharacterized protein n=1 Tax=Eutreptiella gymnastica TaxID=73025 RepID=A0A7S4CZR8_9EUGL